MTERQKNKKPGVFQRGATWSYKYNFQDATGHWKQTWVGGFRTETAAWNAKLEALAKRNRGEDVVTSDKASVEGYLKRWLRDYASGLGSTTHAGYESLFRNHVYPVIGSVLLKKLKPLQIQAIYTGMREKGRSEKTILNCHRALSEALKHAVDWEVVGRNVAASVKKPRPQRYEPVIMPVELVREALALANDGTVGGAVIRFAIYSGMRQGELRRLKRSHVNHQSSSTSIPKAKSKAGVRNLAQTPDGMAILEEQMLQRVKEKAECGPAYKDEGFVFAKPDGSPLTAGACDWAWDKIRQRLGTEARFHDLRHAHASLLLNMGVHPKVVQERLGHASIQITIDIYSHVMPGIDRAAVLPLDALLAPISSGLVAEAKDLD